MTRQISFLVLLVAVLFAVTIGCELDGKCRGGCRRSFRGQVKPQPCDLKCAEVKCVNKCVLPRVCTAKYQCRKRCAYKYDQDLKRTFVRCWCVSRGTCGKCDCRRVPILPWQRISYTPFPV